MRRIQTWLALGLVAAVPGVTVAGSLNSPQLKSSRAIRPTVSQPARKPRSQANQELAEKVAKALRKAQFHRFEIAIDVRDGVVTLDGLVGNPEFREEASRISGSVAGVTGVNNRLRVVEIPSKSPVQQTGIRGWLQRDSRPTIRQTGREVQAPPVARGQTPVTEGAVYSQQNTSGYAGPTYAQYPNYAAAASPAQPATNPWPYMGPFYPYPQAQMGWRKASMYWDSGLWNLNITPNRTKSGWWLDPENW